VVLEKNLLFDAIQRPIQFSRRLMLKDA